MPRYQGKQAVITGGTSGIGLATAKLLVNEGARVLVTGRTKAGLAKAREELGNDGIVAESDGASLADINKLADRAKSEFGTVDLLFVNAGIARFAPFESVTEAAYDELFSLNAKGAYFTVQKFAPPDARRERRGFHYLGCRRPSTSSIPIKSPPEKRVFSIWITWAGRFRGEPEALPSTHIRGDLHH